MSKPDDIPQDVWTAARAAQDEAVAFCVDNKLAVSEYPFASGRAKEALDRSIASALAAERERCAKIADHEAEDWAGEHEKGFAHACRVVADRIRNPSPARAA
jgi:hypothetical protein